jgi:hypothetical protein
MHEGKDPPVPLETAIAKLCCPFLYPEVKISPALLAETQGVDTKQPGKK